MAKKIFDIGKLVAKVKTGQDLTREETIYYLMKAFNHTREEALNIMAIVDNKNPNLIID
jgi:excisionase family DNA binding protein